MDLRKIKKLIEMLQESDLNEIEVKEGEESVRINRKKESVIHASTPISVGQNLNQSSAPLPQTDSSEIENGQAAEDLNHITSPMVGTFYRKPAPDKEPFIEVGQTVKKGDTVCIIEAMKMMNQVQSEFEGKVIDINIEDSDPVEFDQELISIEKS